MVAENNVKQKQVYKKPEYETLGSKPLQYYGFTL